MGPFPWTLLAYVLLNVQATVLGVRLSGGRGVQHCKQMLTTEFPKKSYRVLQSYRLIPSIGNQPEYLEFTLVKGQTFCVNARRAQSMKEYVDSGPTGFAKQRAMSTTTSPAPPKAAPTSPGGQEGTVTLSPSTTLFPGMKEQDPGIGPPTSTFPRPMATRSPEEEGTPAIGPSAKPLPGLQEQDIGTGRPTQLSHRWALARTHKDEGAPTSGPPTTPSPGLKEQDPDNGPSTFPVPQSTATGPPEEEGTPAIGPSAKPLPGLQEQDTGTGRPTQPSHWWASARTHEDEGAPTSGPPTTPSPGLKEQDAGIGLSTSTFPQSTATGSPEEEGTPAIGPSAKPLPGLQEQDTGTGRTTQPSHRWASARTHEDEEAPTSAPPTTPSPGPPERMGQPSLQANTQGQLATSGDVPTGQEPTETSGARNTGSPENPPGESERDKPRTTAHVPCAGTTRRGGGPRSGEGVSFGITPGPGSFQKRHRGAGSGGGNRSGLYVFLGILGVLTFLIILGVIAHKNGKRTRLLQAAQVRLIRYSKVISGDDEIV